MLKNLMKNGITVAAAIGAMALIGCGQNGDSNNNGDYSAANGVSNDASDTAGDTDANGNDATDTPDASNGDGAAGLVEFDDSSAEAAINTYINRLKAGDMVGAAEICVAEAPGTEALLTIGNKIIEMANNPENASLAETTKALFVDDFKTIEAVKTVEEDGVVVYEVSVINKAPVNIRVELRDGVWRVIPPIGGTPVG